MKVYNVCTTDLSTLAKYNQIAEGDSIIEVMLRFERLYPDSKVIIEVWPRKQQSQNEESLLKGIWDIIY